MKASLTSRRGWTFAGIYFALVVLASLWLFVRIRENNEFIDLVPFVVGALALPWSLINWFGPEALSIATLVGGIGINLAGFYWLGTWAERRGHR